MEYHGWDSICMITMISSQKLGGNIELWNTLYLLSMKSQTLVSNRDHEKFKVQSVCVSFK